MLTLMEMMNDMANSRKRWFNFQLPGSLPAASSHLIYIVCSKRKRFYR